jgi:hypothetical protein
MCGCLSVSPNFVITIGYKNCRTRQWTDRREEGGGRGEGEG